VARTVHHTPWKQTTQYRHELFLERAWGGAWYWRGWYVARAGNVIYDLRYPAVELDRPDRRPTPRHVRRSVASYDYVMAYRGSCVGYFANRDERAARARDRADFRRITAAVNAGGKVDVDELEPAQVRHRHRALWDSM
jgi:hypothetical protein